MVVPTATVVAITHIPRTFRRVAAGKPASSRLSHALRFFQGKEVSGMNAIRAQLFLRLRRAWLRLRDPVQCRGQTLVEYALILAIISVVAIGVLINVGQAVKGVYSMIDSQIQKSGSGLG